VALELGGERRRAAQLAAENAAGLERAPGLAQIAEDDFGVGDVLKDGEGIDVIEELVREHLQAGAGDDVDARVRNLAQVPAREGGHFRGNIHAVDFAEVGAHGKHETAGTAADFEGAAGFARGFGQAIHLDGEVVEHFLATGEERARILMAAAEAGVVIGVLTGAAIPIVAHVLNDAHASILSGAERESGRKIVSYAPSGAISLPTGPTACAVG